MTRHFTGLVVGRSGERRLDDGRPVAVALAILGHEPNADTVRAPDAQVRWECLLLLDQLCTRNLVPNDQRDTVRTALITQLDARTDRRVRVSAARGLRHFPHVDTLRSLIKALASPDFGVTSEAERALAALTGTTHDVITGVTLLNVETGARLIRHETTAVTMKPMFKDTLERYLKSGLWQGKAGAYGIQDSSDANIEHLEGSYSNVVGLPIELVEQLCADAGILGAVRA